MSARPKVRPLGVIILAVLLAVSLAAAAAAKRPKVSTRIKVDGVSGRVPGMAEPFQAEGSVSSPKHGCLVGRTVFLHVVSSAGDITAGSDSTVLGAHDEGRWGRIDTTIPAGSVQVYARVTKKVTSKLVCRSAVSKRVTLP
jgi:hypothetical protein